MEGTIRGNWSSFQLAINLDQRISHLDYCPKRKDEERDVWAGAICQALSAAYAQAGGIVGPEPAAGIAPATTKLLLLLLVSTRCRAPKKLHNKARHGSARRVHVRHEAPTYAYSYRYMTYIGCNAE